MYACVSNPCKVICSLQFRVCEHSLYPREEDHIKTRKSYLIDLYHNIDANGAGETPGGQRTVNLTGAGTTSSPGGPDRHGRPGRLAHAGSAAPTTPKDPL